MSARRLKAKACGVPPEERLQVFLTHKPDLKVRNPGPLERMLLHVWDTDENAFAKKSAGLLSAEEIQMLCHAIRTWESGRAPHADDLFSAVFEALPDPVLIFLGEGAVWNRAFVGAVEGAPEWKAYPVAPHPNRLPLLAGLVNLARRLQIRVLLYPLGEKIFQLKSVALEEENLVFLYFRPMHVPLPSLDERARYLVLFRLSGVPLKQIALLLNLSLSTVETLSAQLRKPIADLRSALFGGMAQGESTS